ncbi:MAG TPA: DMT family transporter [Gammaproteobacteria bacterium]|jgi:drug/metabolite transporter (DMT)-like permease
MSTEVKAAYTWRVTMLTVIALMAFAGNSLLCRLALRGGHAEPAAFTLIRLGSGAAVLWIVLRAGRRDVRIGGDWRSALALFVYAITFSFAYLSLSAGTGALLLFGAVQASMLLVGFLKGERLGSVQWLGLAFAVSGLVYMVLPGVEAPAPFGAALMLAAGVAWGLYSLRGQRAGDPVMATAGNFLRATPLAMLVALLSVSRLEVDATGWALALGSGVITSGLGYVIWYTALKDLTATRAAVVQLSVPVIAALGGVVFLDEAFTPRLGIATCVILGGVALAIAGRQARS